MNKHIQTARSGVARRTTGHITNVDSHVYIYFSCPLASGRRSLTKGRVHPRLPPYQRKPNIGSSRRQDFQHPQHPTSALSFCMRATSCKPASFPDYACHEPEAQRIDVSGHCKLPFCERCDHRGPLPFLLVPCVFWLLLVTRSGFPNSRLATALLSNPWMTNSALPHSELASHQYFAIALERARCRMAIAHWNSAVSKSAAELQGATSCLGLGSNCRFAGLERCASSLLLAAESLALVVGEERRGQEFCGLSSTGLLPGSSGTCFKVCGTMICWRGDGPHTFLEHFSLF